MGEANPTATRGIRGATALQDDGPDGVQAATTALLTAMAEVNDVLPEDVAAIVFTVTDDLPAANPAAAARAAGWDDVPLLVVREHGGAGDVPRCLRALALWNTERTQAQVRHVYLGEAARLRPDLTS